MWYWDLVEAKAKKERMAASHELDPALLTVRGMVGILFPDAARASAAPGKRKRESLNSSELWDLPDGATGDDVFRIVETKTNAKRAQTERARKKKEASARRKNNARAELLEVGARIVPALSAAQHVSRLKVTQLKAVLSFRAVDFSKITKKAELADLACKSLQLPVLDPVPPICQTCPM